VKFSLFTILYDMCLFLFCVLLPFPLLPERLFEKPYLHVYFLPANKKKEKYLILYISNK